MNKLIEKAKKIQCLICDVDGVLTNGLLYYDNFGNELKSFHVQDGMGLKLLMAAGIEVAVITTSQNEVIDHRMQQIGIRLYYKGQVDKRAAFADLLQKLNLPLDAFAYIGDDLPDLPIIQQVGLSVAPANAVSTIKEYVNWVTTESGGQGAVREVCDLILNAQQKQALALERYLNV